jgi:hypothetical protein
MDNLTDNNQIADDANREIAATDQTEAITEESTANKLF